jgi:hypothetical protein
LGQSAPAKKVKKPPTFEEYRDTVETATGVLAEAVATAERLMKLYLKDRDSSQTKDLEQDYCGQRRVALVAQREVAKLAKYFKENPSSTQQWRNEPVDDILALGDKLNDLRTLTEALRVKNNELYGMGVSCAGPSLSTPPRKGGKQ